MFFISRCLLTPIQFLETNLSWIPFPASSTQRTTPDLSGTVMRDRAEWEILLSVLVNWCCYQRGVWGWVCSPLLFHHGRLQCPSPLSAFPPSSMEGSSKGFQQMQDALTVDISLSYLEVMLCMVFCCSGANGVRQRLCVLVSLDLEVFQKLYM